MLEMLRNKWIQTSQTGLHFGHNQDEQAWNKENINATASSVKEILFGMKHIIEVDYEKVYEKWDVQGWIVLEEFQTEYFYPNRELGDHAVIHLMRGDFSSDEYIFTKNEFGGDAVFVGTNNDDDALMIALKYK